MSSTFYCFKVFNFVFSGNKCDELRGRTVSSSDGEHFARKHDMMSFLETSAKDGQNVDDVFHKLAKASND